MITKFIGCILMIVAILALLPMATCTVGVATVGAAVVKDVQQQKVAGTVRLPEKNIGQALGWQK